MMWPRDGGQPTILVVEDEGITAWDIEQSLLDLGFQVAGVAATAEDAVLKARESCPDLVLMDIRLQGDGDGIEAASRIRAELGLPIVYLSSHGDRETLDRAKQTEPLAYLLKPFRRLELQSVLEIALHRHAIERRLREREHLLATTLRSIDEAVITADVRGWITSVNAGAEALCGRDAAGAVGRPLAEVLDLRQEWTDERLTIPLAAAVGRTEPSAAPATLTIPSARLVRADGTAKVVALSIAPVADGDEVLGAVLVVRDLTEERLLQQQLEVADRLSTFGLMASAVAHEINNPLAYVLGNLQYGIEQIVRRQEGEGSFDPTPVGDVVDALREAIDGCDRIGRIVRDLRAFNRAESSDDQRVDVHRVLSWAIDVTSQISDGRTEVVHQFGRVPPVCGDETRLGQVFVNLLTNALQSLGEDGPRRVEIATRQNVAGDVEVAVSDTGGGMSPLVLARIFEPFFTTKPTGVGTGLGLAVCRAIVDSLGGQLEAESTLGEGSTFRVTLPSAEPMGDPTPTSSGRDEGGGPAGRVLIVDDDGAVLSLLVRTLRGAHDVTPERSPRAALARLEQGEVFDVVLCDALMPELSGLDVYRTLRERWPALADQFVLVTGGATFEEAAHAGAPIPSHRLLKPFDPARLRALVARLVAQTRS
jgi:PAS domain S-box-containing protein